MADKDTPRALVAPLVEVIDAHVSRTTYNAERDTYSIKLGYFSETRNFGPVLDDDHMPWRPPLEEQLYVPVGVEEVGESPLANHVFFDSVYTVVSEGDRARGVTLYGEMLGHPFYGAGDWVIQVDATLDTETCDATLERVVAGPSQIVLYPTKDEGGWAR